MADGVREELSYIEMVCIGKTCVGNLVHEPEGDCLVPDEGLVVGLAVPDTGLLPTPRFVH